MAVILNGTSQGINCGMSNVLLQDAGSVFVYFEVTTSQTTDGDYACLGMTSSGRTVELVGVSGGSTFQAMLIGGGIVSVQTTGNIKNGVKRRVFVGWSQQSDRRFAYVDGSQTSESVFGGFLDPDNLAGGITTLGYRPWAGDNRFLAGQLEKVAVWTGNSFGTLSAENAAAIALTTAAALPPAYTPDAYWPLDYNARDLGPNALHGTLVGAPTFTEPLPATSRWRRGDGTVLTPFLKTSGGLVALE